MKHPWFYAGFGTVVGAFIALNVVDYFWERANYYRFLEESGSVWAGSWDWGFPLSTMIEGAGVPGEMYSMIAPTVVFNVIICLASAGIVGVTAEYIRYKVRPEAE